jgi:hypothetical protein
MLHMEDLTQNERDWIVFLRMIALDRDPAPTLRRVQLLRRVCEHRRA